MKNTLKIFRSLRAIHWITLLAVGAIGVVGTFAIGQRLEDKAIESWTQQAELDAAVATIAAQSWLAQSETILSGLALGFKQPEEISTEEFDEMVFQAEEWNSEFSLDTVAVIKRVMRPQRNEMEQSLGRVLSDAKDTAVTVPDAFDYMVVINSSNTDGLLRPSVDVLSMVEMGIVVKTAQRVPEKTIMGPAFTDSNGLLFTLVGIGLADKERDTLIVGMVNISEMIDALMLDYASDGLMLRLSERDNEARADTLERPIYGPAVAGNEVLHTVTIRVTRGQARWNYNWDITREYRGGAPTANATMVQIGGLIITILVVYSIGVLSVQNTIIKRTVEDRTKELTEEIAERKKAEKVKRESEESFRSFYEIIPDVFMITNVETGLCVDVNEGFCRVTGYSRSDVIGKRITELDLWEDVADRVQLVQGLEEDGIVNNFDANFYRKDGSLWPGMLSACMTSLNGQPHILTSTKDVSDIRRSEMDAITANKAKSEFLSSMSHELRTPMNAILGFAQILYNNPDDPLTESQQFSVNHILMGGQHLMELINQVLDLARIETGKLGLSLEEVEVDGLGQDCLSMVDKQLQEKSLTLVNNLTNKHAVRADYTRLKQVLLNLLSNAIKYNQEGGNIILTSEDDSNDRIRVVVTDSGIGISEDRQAELFEPFNRLGKEAGEIEGTGIGLTITKQLMEAMGGLVGFESEPGKGSTFWFELPKFEGPDG